MQGNMTIEVLVWRIQLELVSTGIASGRNADNWHVVRMSASGWTDDAY